MGNFIAWDATKGKIVWSKPEQFSVWSGALSTAGGVVFYGTLEGYLKAVDAKTGKDLYKFKTPSGIIGNVMTFPSMETSSTSRFCQGLADGQALVSRQALPGRMKGLARLAVMQRSPTTQRSAAL
jgi:hypothetical protein